MKNDLKILSVFIDPNKFIDALVKKKGVCAKELFIVILLTFMYRYLILEQVDKWFLIRAMLSIGSVAMVQYFIYLVGRGRSNWRLIFNLSIYFHFISLVGSFFDKVPILSILIFLGTHLLVIYYQYVIGKDVMGVNERFIKIFCSIEIISTIVLVNYQLLTYLGRWVIYNKHTHFLPLITK